MSKKLSDLVVGDDVVLFVGSNRPYKFGTVRKVTKTQITVTGERYNRRDGAKIGYGASDKWSITDPPMIAQVGIYVMSIEEGQRRNSELAIKREKYALIAKINDARPKHLEQLSIETLNQVIKLLELEDK